MANTMTFLGNMLTDSDKPYVVPGNFQAGSTQAVEQGDIIELTGATNTAWVPIDSDFAGNANIAVSEGEIRSGDLAGYYGIIVPRPGDVFVYSLAAAGNPTIGTALYYSAAQTVTETAGSNILAYAAGFGHYPYPQGHQSINGAAAPDVGTTIPNTSGTKVHLMFQPDFSYWRAIQPQT